MNVYIYIYACTWYIHACTASNPEYCVDSTQPVNYCCSLVYCIKILPISLFPAQHSIYKYVHVYTVYRRCTYRYVLCSQPHSTSLTCMYLYLWMHSMKASDLVCIMYIYICIYILQTMNIHMIYINSYCTYSVIT